MLTAILASILLENMLAGRGVIRAGEGTNKAGEDF